MNHSDTDYNPRGIDMKKLATLSILLISSTAWSQANINMMDLVKKDHTFIQSQLNSSNCATYLKEINDQVEVLGPKDMDLSRVKDEAAQIIKESFISRLDLQKKFKAMESQNPVEKECVNQVRRKINASRMLEEYVAQIGELNTETDVLSGSEPYLLVNPDFKEFKLQSGDILISRGNAVVSAAIARIGDQEGLFSHAAMVYVDKKTNKTYAIEAHLEIGTDVAPIEEKYMRDGKVRSIVYRPKDKALAERAGEIAYKRAKAGLDKNSRILYDFAMDMNEEEKLFCSEVPFMAYNNASNGSFLLGDRHQTSFHQKTNRSFLDGIGVKANETFSPSDVELDSKLELVAEWRDLGQAYKTHRKDAVMASVYKWLEKDGYRLDVSQSTLKARMVIFLRHMPLFGSLLKNSIAKNITKSTLRTMMMMDAAGSAMLDALIESYDQYKQQTGYPMTYPQMLAALEELKTEDLERDAYFKEWQRANPVQGGDSSTIRPDESRFVKFFKR
ncbi:MAG: hypothetical protein BroJett040_07780 [Oligoflexia bacterium]|nr:MAG: hypothetical protein BroJett040_07780 [Oligoflexia bacterium]